MGEPNDGGAPRSVEQLEDMLSAPDAGVIELLGKLDGDLVLLGVGGKMGPSLARMAVRASREAGRRRRVIGVSRFSDATLQQQLTEWGVETIAADLLDEATWTSLPDAALVVVMTGLKFGLAADPARAWAMNCYLPALVCRRYRGSRLVAFSSGNVYGMVPVAGGGSRESDPPRPQGEYAVTVLGRERMYSYFSQRDQVACALLRLNYATEMRYGVLVDIAQHVWEGRPLDVTMGHVNVIWQRDANALSLRALGEVAVPARILNIAGPEILRVRDVAESFGRLLDRPVDCRGQEAEDAFLSNATLAGQLWGPPQVDAEQLIRWTAQWILQDGCRWDKPTHFQNRSGSF